MRERERERSKILFCFYFIDKKSLKWYLYIVCVTLTYMYSFVLLLCFYQLNTFSNYFPFNEIRESNVKLLKRRYMLTTIYYEWRFETFESFTEISIIGT